jgi:lysosomal acid lipase/cholesteryl ester hydrolase
MQRLIPLHTLDGVPDAEASVHPFSTEDGLGLSLLRFCRADRGDIVLLVHGLTSSSDMFIMPEHRNLVTTLLDAGFTDVWILDSRMSNRFPYALQNTQSTLDDIALFDYPAALQRIRERVGQRRIHVVSHCLGSTSFLMSLSAGVVDGVASVVANSVGLIPRVPAWSRAKLTVGPELVEYVLGSGYLTPAWSEDRPLTRGWAVSKLVSLLHPECDVPACHMISVMWGTGWPGLYSHDKLHPVTHARLGDLLGGSGLSYYRHVRKMVRAGRAVKYDPDDPRYAALPDDYLAGAAAVRTPILFLTGTDNRTFTDSNVVCFEELDAAAPGRHELRVVPEYGHLDVFIGRTADADVFPILLEFLTRQAATTPATTPATTAATTPATTAMPTALSTTLSTALSTAAATRLPP